MKITEHPAFLSMCKMKWHTVIPKVNKCFRLLFRLLRPVQEISLKYGDEHRGFSKNTHTYGSTTTAVHGIYYLFSVHQN